MSDLTADRILLAYETAKAALLAEIVSEPVAADDPVQKMLDEPVSEMRHWVGRLSTSALSTATAVMALEQMRRQFVSVGREVPETWTRLIRGGVEWLVAHQNPDGGWGDTVKSISNISTTMLCHAVLHAAGGLASLPLPLGEGRGEGLEAFDSRREGDHDKSDRQTACSSSTSTVDRVPHPAFGHPLPEGEGTVSRAVRAAQAYIEKAGGVKAVIKRYTKDRTFSVPILTHCALAGLVNWDDVISLPFELACIPARFYAAVRLPVVSYALPALIAIGQVRFHFRPSRNPLRRWLQRWAKPASLKVLERIQPPNGGFLEATPLTSFVTMSLVAMGLIDHPVTRRGVEFIVASVRWDDDASRHRACPGGSTASALLREGDHDDSNSTSAKAVEPLGQAQGRDDAWACSWPIDTNLATWVTTLAVNALGADVPLDARPGLRAWLLRQQFRVVHPYTNAAPGGWAWTDLPGGVPDGDDTPGAMLALRVVGKKKKTIDALKSGMVWLSGLQNRDGGWPTFCRGWGTLPFDRSSPDITAHAARALDMVLFDFDEMRPAVMMTPQQKLHFQDAEMHLPAALTEYWRGRRAFERFLKSGYFERAQRADGSWLPLWFGNQHAPNDENPTYGTAKVLAAFQALGRMSDESAVRGARWLVENQNPDGGWGAGPGTPSSVEETTLAMEALLGLEMSPLPLGEGGRRPGEGREAVDAPMQGYGESGDDSGKSVSQKTSTVDRLPRPSPLPRGEGTGQDEASIARAIQRGLSWLIPRVEDGRFREPAPIGFYFAKLWYFEALYPLIFTVAALRKAAAIANQTD